MRAKWILTLLFFSLPLHAQYTTTYHWAVSDLSSKMASNSLWWALPSGICNIMGVSYNGKMFCTGNGTPTPSAANWLYEWNTSTQQWQVISGIGQGTMGFAAISDTNIYVLKTTPSCTAGGGGYGIFHWNGSTLAAISGCLAQVAAGEDGSLVGANKLTNVFYLAPGASSWVHAGGDSSTGWTYTTNASGDNICGVKNGLVYLYNSSNSGFVQMSPQPGTANETFVTSISCHVSEDPNDGLTLYAVYNATISRRGPAYYIAKFDFTSSTWTELNTNSLQPMSVASISKWQTVMADFRGYPYHFNVFGVYHDAVITGSVVLCPPPNPCPTGGVTHNGTVQARLPGGLYGAQAASNVPPTSNLNVTSYDVTATGCDALFGDLTQCNPQDTGTVICSASGFNFSGTPSNGNPPLHATFAEYVGGWDGFFQNESVTYSTFMGLPYITAYNRAGDTVNACRPGTYSPCNPPYGQDTVGTPGICWGVGCTAAIAINAGKTNAKAHIPSNGKAWSVFSTRIPGDPNSCNVITVNDEIPGVVPCF